MHQVHRLVAELLVRHFDIELNRARSRDYDHEPARPQQVLPEPLYLADCFTGRGRITEEVALICE